jgi:16S rRNA (uracil1498-N3)-methyltransferase
LTGIQHVLSNIQNLLKLSKQSQQIKANIIESYPYFDIDFNDIIYHIEIFIMELFYTNAIDESRSEAEFDSFESKHLLKTLRKREGDSVYFTDGQGKLFQGKIASTKPGLRVQFQLIEQLPWPPPSRSILGIGFIRPSRLDTLIEKATELGINKFHFFASRYTNYYSENTGRWDKIIRQAIKQSQRLYLPEIQISSSFSKFINTETGTDHKFLADQKSPDFVIERLYALRKKTNEDIIFIIGPEGGFDDQEKRLAENHEFIPVSFGDNRLRSETAAISAASYINLIRN